MATVEKKNSEGKVRRSKPSALPTATAQVGALTLAEFRDRYIATNREAPERRSIEGIERHFKHWVASLGERFPIGELNLISLYFHIARRAKASVTYGRPGTARRG